MTTRSQAVEEKLSTIMAMMESQQQRQEQLLVQADELAERQKEFQQQLEEMHQLRDYVRGLGESMEERLKATELSVEAIKREPTEVSERDLGHTPVSVDVKLPALRPTAPVFRPAMTESGERSGGAELEGMESGERSGVTHGRTSVGADRIIRPSPYDGRTPWDAYKTQFEMLAELNGWTDREKATFLAVNLKGPALAVLGNLPQRSRNNYGALASALDTRFGVAHQTELNRARLRNRRRQRDEGLPELAKDIERLARLAYPDADSSMLEVLGKDQFIDALLDDDARLRIRQMRPATLRAALEHALELESYQLANQQVKRAVRGIRVGESQMPRQQRQSEPGYSRGGEEMLHECLKLLQQCVVERESKVGGNKEIPKWRKRNRTDITCWKCKEKGHIQKNCPQRTVDEVSSMSARRPGNLNGK